MVEARTLAFNDRIYERMEKYGEIKDDFARRVIENRLKLYEEPEYEESEGLIVIRYLNPTRNRRGIAIGVLSLDKKNAERLKQVELGDEKEVVIVNYAKQSRDKVEEYIKPLAKGRHLTYLHGGEYPMFNLMRHVLVPLHVVLTEDEKAEIFRKYRVPLDEGTRFPLIYPTDPVALLIGALKGDLVMILRESETAGQAIYFRYVGRPEEIRRKRDPFRIFMSMDPKEFAQRLLEEARKEAEKIIKEAEEKAREIIENARREAEKIRRQKEQEARRLIRAHVAKLVGKARREARMSVSLKRRELVDRAIEEGISLAIERINKDILSKRLEEALKMGAKRKKLIGPAELKELAEANGLEFEEAKMHGFRLIADDRIVEETIESRAERRRKLLEAIAAEELLGWRVRL